MREELALCVPSLRIKTLLKTACGVKPTKKKKKIIPEVIFCQKGNK